MTDYSKLSDFEINSAVHNALMKEPYKIEFLGNDRIRWVSGSTNVTTEKVEYSKKSLKDYCNNPADAWPLVVENDIALLPSCGFDWVAISGLTLNSHSSYIDERLDDCLRHSDMNPLRAAMIVFLMMQEEK